MGGVNLNKKLWRIPQQGMVKGVCAGIAQYLDVPVKLVRILVVLSILRHALGLQQSPPNQVLIGLSLWWSVRYNRRQVPTGAIETA